MPPPRLAFFDLDGTLIHGDSVSLFLHCLKDEGITDSAYCAGDEELLAQFYEGKLDIIKYYRYSLQPLAGKTKEDLADVFSKYLKDYVRPRVYDEALTTIEELKTQGYKIIIVSATTDVIVAEIATRIFKADHFIATRVKSDSNGRLIADVYPDISHQEGKASRIKELAVAQGYSLNESLAYGDSINDISMLELASKQFVVNPAGRMDKEAQKRGFTILKWHAAV